MDKSDEAALRAHHEFVRDEEKDRASWSRWETRMAARYYRKLHKEYAVVDLSRYREGKCGLRWRTERELLEGKGEVICAAKGCERQGRKSYELPFSYVEGNEEKCELVKVRCCEKCSRKLSKLGASSRHKIAR